jgi:hypothetical protein
MTTITVPGKTTSIGVRLTPKIILPQSPGGSVVPVECEQHYPTSIMVYDPEQDMWTDSPEAMVSGATTVIHVSMFWAEQPRSGDISFIALTSMEHSLQETDTGAVITILAPVVDDAIVTVQAVCVEAEGGQSTYSVDVPLLKTVTDADQLFAYFSDNNEWVESPKKSGGEFTFTGAAFVMSASTVLSWSYSTADAVDVWLTPSADLRSAYITMYVRDGDNYGDEHITITADTESGAVSKTVTIRGIYSP